MRSRCIINGNQAYLDSPSVLHMSCRLVYEPANRPPAFPAEPVTFGWSRTWNGAHSAGSATAVLTTVTVYAAPRTQCHRAQMRCVAETAGTTSATTAATAVACPAPDMPVL